MEWLQIPGRLLLGKVQTLSPPALIALVGFLSVVLLVSGGWALWYGTQDRTGGAWRHRRPRRPRAWHRAPSGEYIMPVGAYRTRDSIRRHRAADLDSPTTHVRWRGAARVPQGHQFPPGRLDRSLARDAERQ